jgi:hypothetical protein
MNGFFKTIIAGWGAKKLGGGCFSTIIIFVLIYWALGQCNKSGSRPAANIKAPVQTEQRG